MAIRALAFDVFGTVVDWRGSIVREGAELNRSKGLEVDWGRVADAWRGRYRPFMDRVRTGELPWMPLDGLHRLALDEVLAEFGLEERFSEAERATLNLAWHRLQPWPDAVAGLARLRERFLVCTLSNGNVRLLVDLARYGGLGWDCILSAELVRAYKPDPRVYRMVPELLDLRPDEVMLVAAHLDDLRAALDQGLRAAYVARPLEFGPGREAPAADPAFDVAANDFLDLSEKLAAA